MGKGEKKGKRGCRGGEKREKREKRGKGGAKGLYFRGGEIVKLIIHSALPKMKVVKTYKRLSRVNTIAWIGRVETCLFH